MGCMHGRIDIDRLHQRGANVLRPQKCDWMPVRARRVAFAEWAAEGDRTERAPVPPKYVGGTMLSCTSRSTCPVSSLFGALPGHNHLETHVSPRGCVSAAFVRRRSDPGFPASVHCCRWISKLILSQKPSSADFLPPASISVIECRRSRPM